MTLQLISIVLPVYNQADHIGGIVESYREALAKVPNPYEMILVVNGSTDDSFAICRALAERDHRIQVVHSGKGGWGLAVKLGLEKATGDILCYANSARTSPEVLVLLLLYAVAYPGVVVKANRKIREKWKLQRRIGSLIYNIECRTLFDLSNWDINGTPKVFPKSFDKLLKLSCTDDLIDAEFCAVCRDENYPMVEVPINSPQRHGGESTTGYRTALRLYWGAIQLWRERRFAAITLPKHLS